MTLKASPSLPACGSPSLEAGATEKVPSVHVDGAKCEHRLAGSAGNNPDAGLPMRLLDDGASVSEYMNHPVVGNSLTGKTAKDRMSGKA